MACMPLSGCERQVTEPFVAYLNTVEGTAYSFVRCLDKQVRSKKQPEILYASPTTGGDLVIEVKNMVWPLKHAQYHQTDHKLANMICDLIRGHLEDAPYALTLPHCIRGRSRDITVLGQTVAQVIISHLGAVNSGMAVRGATAGRRWTFRRMGPEELEPDDPINAILIEWALPNSLDPDRRDRAKADLSLELMRHYKACEGKFAEYLSSRRILLLALTGDVWFSDDDWTALVALAPVPPAITEVWVVEGFSDADIAMEFYRVDANHHARSMDLTSG